MACLSRSLTVTLIAAVMLLVSQVAQAEELIVLANGRAVHLGEKRNFAYNERNRGGELQYEFQPWKSR